MGSINWGRVILGGLVAAIVINIGEFLLNTLLVAEQWEATLAELGKSMADQNMVVWVVFSLLQGLFCVWFYAAIRPRYGAGPKTAACAGIAVWFASSFLFAVAMWNIGLFPTGLLATTAIWALVELPIATIAGAWLYREA